MSDYLHCWGKKRDRLYVPPVRVGWRTGPRRTRQTSLSCFSIMSSFVLCEVCLAVEVSPFPDSLERRLTRLLCRRSLCAAATLPPCVRRATKGALREFLADCVRTLGAWAFLATTHLGRLARARARDAPRRSTRQTAAVSGRAAERCWLAALLSQTEPLRRPLRRPHTAREPPPGLRRCSCLPLRSPTCRRRPTPPRAALPRHPPLDVSAGQSLYHALLLMHDAVFAPQGALRERRGGRPRARATAATNAAGKHPERAVSCLAPREGELTGSAPQATRPPCDVCAAPALFFCRHDRAFLCRACDVGVHSASPEAARHERYFAPISRVGLEAAPPPPGAQLRRALRTARQPQPPQPQMVTAAAPPSGLGQLRSIHRLDTAGLSAAAAASASDRDTWLEPLPGSSSAQLDRLGGLCAEAPPAADATGAAAVARGPPLGLDRQFSLGDLEGVFDEPALTYPGSR